MNPGLSPRLIPVLDHMLSPNIEYSIGSNIDVALQSESLGVQIDPPTIHPGAGIGERQARAATPNPTPFSPEVQQKIEASTCRSLILTI